MKPFFLILLIVSGLSTAVWANQSKFTEAHQALTHKNPLGAIQTLQSRISSITATAGEWQLYSIAVWNAFGEDSLGAAIRAATASNRLDPSKENQQLLEWLQQKVPNRIEGVPAIAPVRLLKNMILRTPWWLLTGLSALGLVGIASRWLVNTPIGSIFGRYTKQMSIVGAILFLLCLSSSWYHHRVITEPIAFVTQSGVSVFQKPDLSSKEIASVSVGTEVEPQNTFGRWQEVKLPDGRVGWMQGSILEYLIIE